MTSFIHEIENLQNIARSGIHRKIVGDHLIAQNFFQFLIAREKPDIEFLALCTNHGLILDTCCPHLSESLEGCSISLQNFITPAGSFLQESVPEKFLLLYLPAFGSEFDVHKFANSLSTLIRIADKNSYLLNCLDFVDNTICIYDKEAFLLYANKSYCEHFNIQSREDAIGMHIHNITAQSKIQITASKTRSNNLKMMDVLKNGKKILDWEIDITPDNLPGNANSISNNMYPFKDENGTVQGLVEISSTQNINLKQTKKLLGMSSEYTFDSIIGNSDVISNLKAEALEYAQSRYNLLIVGESGTGKELFAQAVHNASSRKNGPFVAINCASLPDNLIESELFGYVSGAFTGASKNGQIGKFELADGGTLFLDEIGELPIQFQPKLLRALETGTITRIGSSTSKSVDVRVIAATNRNLPKMIQEGFFREDLYYRLQILNIIIPPLRERKEDILLLVNAFLTRTAEAEAMQPPKLSPKAKTTLLQYDWPGNVRELRNVVYRLSLLSKGETISSEEVEDAIHSKGFRLNKKEIPVENPEERLEILRTEIDHSYEALIKEALFLSDNKKQKAAELLGVDRKTLYRMIKKYCKEEL